MKTMQWNFVFLLKKVLSMCKAYAAEGGALYQNQDMLKDITNILDFLCGSCYTAKSQTDNWWNMGNWYSQGFNSCFNIDL